MTAIQTVIVTRSQPQVVVVRPLPQVDVSVPGIQGRGPTGPAGPTGPVGPTGTTGNNFQLSGSVATYAALPTLTSSDAGQAWLVNADGRVYVWNGTAWPADGTGAVLSTGASFHFHQPSAAQTWPINHALNKYPSVTVIDSAGTQVFGSVDYTDANNLTVSFAAAFAGDAYLN